MERRLERALAERRLETIFDESKPRDNHLRFTVTNVGINLLGDGIAWFTLRVSHTKTNRGAGWLRLELGLAGSVHV